MESIKRGERNRCWCGGALQRFEWSTRYGVCAKCGCYVNRFPPIGEDLKVLYSFRFYWHTFQRVHGYPTIEERTLHDNDDGRVDYWLRLIERYGPLAGRVVEVGCAHGVLLTELQVRGYECVGVEPDPQTATWTRTHTGLDIRAGFFPGVALPPCSLFLAFDVLEHSPTPLEFLHAAAELLEPRGVAIIQTPVDRYDLSPPFGDRFDDAFRDEQHLFLFTDRALKELACRANLEIVSLAERLALHHEICVFRRP